MYGAQIAFKNFIPIKGILGSEWIGFKNFSRFFTAYDFWRIMSNTLYISVYSLAVGIPIPIMLALGLNYVNHKLFKKSVQLITYAPHLISVVVMVGIILQLLQPRTGIVNHLLVWLNIGSINFMGNPDYFKSIYVWSSVWQNMGYACIIYLAALSSIDPALHEAGIVDGATIVQRIRHIDIPGIMPLVVIILILDTGHILDIGFEKVLLMQNPLNIRTSEVIDTYVYKVGIASSTVNYSYAAAIGLFKSVIGFILVLACNRLARKVGQTSLW
jgi:multiple sugar transport system permease protein/putative aldouronate transport system permease protein